MGGVWHLDTFRKCDISFNEFVCPLLSIVFGNGDAALRYVCSAGLIFALVHGPYWHPLKQLIWHLMMLVLALYDIGILELMYAGVLLTSIIRTAAWQQNHGGVEEAGCIKGRGSIHLQSAD